jgi:hypothetical protein
MLNDRPTTLPPPVPGNGVQNSGIIGRLSLWLYILLLLLLLLLLLYRIKKNEMGGTCGTYGGEVYTGFLVGKPEGKRRR